MKVIALAVLLASSVALACPVPTEYPKETPFLACPTKLTQKRVPTACLEADGCLWGTRSEWHYTRKPAQLRADWIALLRSRGWKVYPMEGTWVQATKGKDQVLNA